MTDVRPEIELERLQSGTCSDPPPAGMSRFEIDAYAPLRARDVLNRTKEVLDAVIRRATEPWPDIDKWRAALPAWFVHASVPERTPEEARAWLDQIRTLPQEERVREMQNRRWSIGSFTHWFQPDERVWWWWGSELLDAGHLRICLVVTELSFPHEALDWLLRASGAERVIDENVRDLMRRQSQIRG